jgi:hypothetical protein
MPVSFAARFTGRIVTERSYCPVAPAARSTGRLIAGHPRGPHGQVGGRCGIRTGAGPAKVVMRGAARIAEHVASHHVRRYSDRPVAAVQARRTAARPSYAVPEQG